MTLPAPTYDLMLLLDPQAEDSERAKIVSDSRGAIEGQGELVRHDNWGERPLTYPIERRSSAEYHLLQFHAGAPELLSGLDRTLRIADGVLRFRIIKLAPGTPDPPSVGAAARSAEAGESAAPQAASAASAAPAAPAPAPPAEAPGSEAAPAQAEPAEAASAQAEPAEAGPAQAEPAEPAEAAGETAGAESA
ncbi:MAG TPA: 30S ribosomal protein S6 [Solirubrobacteraceae bacterium]|jgi:small subunit ribosomal protein S6